MEDLISRNQAIEKLRNSHLKDYDSHMLGFRTETYGDGVRAGMRFAEKIISTIPSATLKGKE